MAGEWLGSVRVSLKSDREDLVHLRPRGRRAPLKAVDPPPRQSSEVVTPTLSSPRVHSSKTIEFQSRRLISISERFTTICPQHPAEGAVDRPTTTWTRYEYNNNEGINASFNHASSYLEGNRATPLLVEDSPTSSGVAGLPIYNLYKPSKLLQRK